MRGGGSILREKFGYTPLARDLACETIEWRVKLLGGLIGIVTGLIGALIGLVSVWKHK